MAIVLKFTHNDTALLRMGYSFKNGGIPTRSRPIVYHDFIIDEQIAAWIEETGIQMNVSFFHERKENVDMLGATHYPNLHLGFMNAADAMLFKLTWL